MLSILIPTYNYDVFPLVKNLCKQCLQENILFEIIVLDDFSHNDFIRNNEKLASLTNCQFTVNGKNLGRTMTRQKLAEGARYETLLFLDADVIPVHEDYIKLYLPFIEKKTPVVFGGIAYQLESENKKAILRLKYGKEREQRTAKDRAKKPYGTLFSANLLIQKNVFLKNNYSENGNFYGMDIYFSYMLYRKNIQVVHIDNPVYHIGLEDDTVYFEKSLKAVKIRKELLSEKEGIENINSLLKHYKTLRKYHLSGFVNFLFKFSEPVLKRLILSKNPNLFCLDIYRLGYICSLKTN